MIARRLTVYGRVQGVFYRDWTVENACELGLAGWVRNQPDGTVVRKTGVMSVVIAGGTVRPGDPIRVELPSGEQVGLQPV